MPLSPASQLIRFDVFELDLRTAELRKHGLRIRLQDQPFRILCMLLENPGEIVTADELKKKIWPEDTFVDFDHGLHAAVGRLREKLGDSADNPKYIETIPRRGYRFIGQVLPDVATPSPVLSPNPQSATALKPIPFARSSWTGALAGFLLALVVGAGLVSVNFYGLRDWLFGATHPQIRSLAVLPLEDVDGEASHQYISEGFTEDLTTQLSQLRDLRVISHTSVMQYRKVNKSLREIAQELKVDAVVEGAVELAGDHVRISAQLVDARNDQQIWAQKYDRELKDVLLLQSEVTKDIADQIALKLTPQQQQRLNAGASLVNPEAYQAYLLGRYYWNLRTEQGLQQARTHFDQAIQKDPKFAPAYSGLADYYAYLSVLGGPEVLKPQVSMTAARKAAQTALQLDPSSAEAHASMGNILHNYDWDWAAAEREFQRAIELNANYPTAHHLYAHLLIESGRTSEALDQERRALELDPYSPFINNGQARLYYLSRDYQKAIAQCQVGLQINPAYLPVRIQLALAYEQVGKLDQAIDELEQAAGVVAGSKSSADSNQHPIDLPVLHALLAHAYALAGRRPEAETELKKLEAQSAKRYISPAYFGIVWMALGDHTKAFKALNDAYADRSEHVLYLGLEPIIDPLRSDPQFDQLVKKVGLKR